MPTEKPASQRPELPDFWDQRFRTGVTPWDAGKAPQALREFAAGYPAADTPHVLIPGCGSAWDAAFLDSCGWHVSALDFSAAAVEAARLTLGEAWRGKLLCADFFTFSPEQRFDLIYERAFLCALPRALWPAYAPRMAELLPPGGLLIGSFFIADQPKGPPFGILAHELDALLTPHFTRREDRPVDDSLPVFAGCERWQVWQRR
ncbi:MAG: methyltransferase domain-containing protein [Rhodocyclaceae bacterium]